MNLDRKKKLDDAPVYVTVVKTMMVKSSDQTVDGYQFVVGHLGGVFSTGSLEIRASERYWRQTGRVRKDRLRR